VTTSAITLAVTRLFGETASTVRLVWDGSPLEVRDKGEREIEVHPLSQFELLSVNAGQRETKEAVIHWHLDEDYLTTTRHFHKITLKPKPGEHLLVLVDNEGKRLTRKFRVIGKTGHSKSAVDVSHKH